MRSSTTDRNDLDALVASLQNSRGLAHKRDIAGVVQALGIASDHPFANGSIPVGDDCAAIPDANGDGYLLFAIEGFINEFVRDDPWFAGWCGVMVNVSDIYAMGGRPIAVVDAIWDRGDDAMQPVLSGLAAAAKTYDVPIVGGHSNARSQQAQLAVAILGRARNLLTSFDARPGDVLVAAIDLRAQYREPFAHWNATGGADPQRLRADLEILPLIAEAGLCKAAKDISQAGILGTAMMLLECSGIGATIDINAIPRPVGIDPQRWLLSTFPSYGFLLAVPPQHLQDVLGLFDGRDISCAPIGVCDDVGTLRLRADSQIRTAWNFHQAAVIGCGAGAMRAAAATDRDAPHETE
jgi:AIR synthase-related protein